MPVGPCSYSWLCLLYTSEVGQVFKLGTKYSEAMKAYYKMCIRDRPFGGYKQSGLGRENGEAGFEEFLETKAILI